MKTIKIDMLHFVPPVVQLFSYLRIIFPESEYRLVSNTQKRNFDHFITCAHARAQKQIYYFKAF